MVYVGFALLLAGSGLRHQRDFEVVGLFVTLFAFPGVNMFLSGLHSYGEL